MRYLICAYGYETEDDIILECADREDMGENATSFIYSERYREVVTKVEQD